MKKSTLISLAIAAWLTIAAAGFAWWTNRYFPIDEWLAFFWMRAWAGALFFGIASLAVGVWLLRLLRIPFGTLGERFTLAFGLGVLTFALGIFLFGSLGLLGHVFFFMWPAALLLAGGRTLARQARHVLYVIRRTGGRVLLPASGWQTIAMAFLLLGTLGLYIQALTPGNISFDARWYHLPIAEAYAATGRIRPFPEGWYLAAYPHLASWLYAWAFLAPGGVRHHLCLAAHLEFVVFIAMLPGAAAFARRLLGWRRLRGASAAVFLFPTLFAYGPNLNGGADHVLGLWAAPIGLVLLRYLASADLAEAFLLGAFLGAAGLTKYQALYWIPPIGAVLAIHAVRRRAIRPLLVATATALVVSAPFWLKNLIAYGDPVYPNLHAWLRIHPFHPGAAEQLKANYHQGTGDRSLAERLRDAPLNALIYSFAPKGWGGVGRGAPVFGSLFTLLAPLAFVLRPRWRLIMVVACLHVSIMVWDFVYPEERYLQTVLPWMAAFFAAVMAGSWHLGSKPVRLALVLLVGVQLAWRSDTFFFRNHAMIGDAPIKGFLDFLSPTDAKPISDRRYPGEDLAAIGAALPRNAHVVAHDFYQSMGSGVWIIVDNPYWEGGLEYLQTDTPEATMGLWRKFGATDVLWPEAKGAQNPEASGRYAVMIRAMLLDGEPPLHVAGWAITPLKPDGARPRSVAERQFEQSPTQIAWLTCQAERRLGIYSPAGLGSGATPRPLDPAALKNDPSSALSGANVVLTRAGCPEADAAAPALAAQFRKATELGDVVLWVRPPAP
jgi:hypothetical protein